MPRATFSSAAASERLPGTARPSPTRGFLIANAVVFQACWFACVLGAVHRMAWLGTASVALMLAWHLASVARPAQELKLVGCALVVGAVFNALLAGTGAVTYPEGPPVVLIGPHWMLALWALFALSLNVSLRWLKRRWWLATALGAVVAPISFWGGVRMGAASFPDPVFATVLLAIGWALAMPALMGLSLRFDGVTQPVPRSATLGA